MSSLSAGGFRQPDAGRRLRALGAGETPSQRPAGGNRFVVVEIARRLVVVRERGVSARRESPDLKYSVLVRIPGPIELRTASRRIWNRGDGGARRERAVPHPN